MAYLRRIVRRRLHADDVLRLVGAGVNRDVDGAGARGAAQQPHSVTAAAALDRRARIRS